MYAFRGMQMRLTIWIAIGKGPMSEYEKIFKAYDIRGRTDTGELDAEGASRIGAAFARFAVAEAGRLVGAPG